MPHSRPLALVVPVLLALLVGACADSGPPLADTRSPVPRTVYGNPVLPGETGQHDIHGMPVIVSPSEAVEPPAKGPLGI